MKSRATADFWQSYHRLPARARKQADKAYALFRANPSHPALRFKKLATPPNHYSVRINDIYRAVSVKDGETLLWFWLGTHNEFDNSF